MAWQQTLLLEPTFEPLAPEEASLEIDCLIREVLPLPRRLSCQPGRWSCLSHRCRGICHGKRSRRTGSRRPRRWVHRGPVLAHGGHYRSVAAPKVVTCLALFTWQPRLATRHAQKPARSAGDGALTSAWFSTAQRRRPEYLPAALPVNAAAAAGGMSRESAAMSASPWPRRHTFQYHCKKAWLVFLDEMIAGDACV